MNIFEKLMMISNEIGTLNKDLNVEMSNGKQYSAISEKSVLDAVKPLEYKYRVFSYPVKRTRTSQTMRRDWKDANGQARVTTLFVDRVDVTYRFVNVDDPSQFIEVDSFGTGIDTGDKGPGKAMTYADKYALMKAYKLAAGNASDPDTFGSPTTGVWMGLSRPPAIRGARIHLPSPKIRWTPSRWVSRRWICRTRRSTRPLWRLWKLRLSLTILPLRRSRLLPPRLLKPLLTCRL